MAKKAISAAVTIAPAVAAGQAKKLLTCPVRGQLNASVLAKDGLTITEESRRIDFLNLLLKRGYPKNHISVETVILKSLGEQGRNKLRTDVLVFDEPVSHVDGLDIQEKVARAILVAEIKRDSKSKASGVAFQLEPALLLLPNMNVLGVYWDDVNQILFNKKITKSKGKEFVSITQDNIANLPTYGTEYKSKPITIETLTPSKNLMGVLFAIANVLRSHKVNDEHTRYKETVKLILARYCDEREAAQKADKQLKLQVLPGADPHFLARVNSCYDIAAKRYKRATTLFGSHKHSELSEIALRDVVKVIQGIEFSSTSSEVMQQIFMSFVPAVFKKGLDQYFTPLSLIDAMVDMVRIGPNDTIADPAMGTADFLTAAMFSRQTLGEDDVIQRIYGTDADPMAFDLAVVNMILHKDGQSNLSCEDSIENHTRWAESIDIALCNPPFGEKSVERRPAVLKHYDLGHRWIQDDETGQWAITEELVESQQLGILFIEKCWKMLSEGGRMAIILPEGYLCTTSYGYVRTWILEHLRILSVVELPRRIFTRSEADLRANILVGQKLSDDDLSILIKRDYPIHAELVRKVGFKMGKGFSIVPIRDPETGIVIRDDENEPLIDSDFTGVRDRFSAFTAKFRWEEPVSSQPKKISDWIGARFSNVAGHPNLDMKPRRLTIRALQNLETIKAGNFVELRAIADVIEETVNLEEIANFAKKWRLVEGQNIRAVEGVVVPQLPCRAWEIVERKQREAYSLKKNDIVVGLVRPERRNVGLLLADGEDLVGSTDGVAVVRLKKQTKATLSQEWLFASLRSEKTRLQLWTESGGTSYGKLTRDHLLNVLLPIDADVATTTTTVKNWAKEMNNAFLLWEQIGSAEDRIPIINSPMLGLEAEE